MDMDFKVGDKVTIEFEVVDKTDNPHSARMGTMRLSATNQELGMGGRAITVYQRPGVFVTHTPKPVEPAAGQVWSDRNQEYHHRVKAVFDGFVVFMNSTSNQPHTLSIGQFQESRRYVSG